MLQKSISRRTVFVALPFNSGHSGKLRTCIEHVCDEHGFLPIFPNPTPTGAAIPIMEHVTQAIRKAEILIVDISDANANVMYELGYAHSKRGYDPVILIRNNTSAALPFDIGALHCHTFDLNTKHGKQAFENSIGSALQKISRQSEPIVINSFEERTKRLNEELRIIASLSDAKLRKNTIRYSGSTSAFAFGDDENVPFALQQLLAEERKLLVDLAARGCRIKCIITPPGPKAFVPDGRSRAQRRVRRLMTFLESGCESLESITWAVSPYFQRNLYIIGTTCLFEGYKTTSEIGFDMTHQRTGRWVITDHIAFYDNLFDRLRSNSSGTGRDSTLKTLRRSLTFLRRAAL